MAAGSFTPLSSCSPGSSSSTGNYAGDVEALLAEAADLVALEQIARLNTAHLSDDALPTDVESRFRRLKTFPAADPPLRRSSASADPPPPLEEDAPAGDKPDGARLPEKKESGAAAASPEPLFPSPSPSTGGSPSPPPRRRACCFGFSPRKGGAVVRRKQDEDEGHLSEAVRRRAKELWKAMRVEEEKVVREAKGMTRWMKQASAGMALSTAAVDELLSDLEDEVNAKKKPSFK